MCSFEASVQYMKLDKGKTPNILSVVEIFLFLFSIEPDTLICQSTKIWWDLLRNLTFEVCHLKFSICVLTFYIWHLTFDFTFDVWCFTFNFWHFAFDVWHLLLDNVWSSILNLEFDFWYIKFNIWCLTF